MGKLIGFGIIMVLLISVLAFWLAQPVIARAEKPNIKNWVCYYGNRFGPGIYSRFDLVVFDGINHPPLIEEKNGRPIFLGYASVGELDKSPPLWHRAKGKPFLIKKNEFWDSWIVDVRDEAWQSLLFKYVIASVFKRGFDGIFLDTFDSSLDLIRGDGANKYNGTRAALVEITKRIRKEYPDKYIAVNRGLPILSDIAPYIDFIVAEDLYSFYNDNKKDYVRVQPETRNILLKQIEEGLKVNPDLIVLSLDYAEETQTDIIKEAIMFSNKKGFIPYISTYRLDEIFFHTLTP